MISAVLILVMVRNELTMDVSGAWVSKVSPMLSTSSLFSPEHIGSLFYEHDSETTGDNDTTQTDKPLRYCG